MSSKFFSREARAAVAAGLALTLALGGCSVAGGSASGTGTASGVSVSGAGVTSVVGEGAVQLIDTSSVFSERDLDPSYDAVTATIELSDNNTQVTGSGVTVDGNTVTITEAGTYVVSGSLADGRLVVDAPTDAKVQLVLNGVSVTSSGAAALLVRQADKVFLTLADGTSNTLAATGEAEADGQSNVDGTVFSKDDLTVNGAGALAVSSAAGHGIVVKDDLVCAGGEVEVTAAGHAVQAKDSVAFAAGTWRLAGVTDAVHCSNSDDAEKGWIYVAGGILELTAGSDGMDAGNVLQIDGGSVTVSAGDDGIHAEYDLAINAGEVRVTQSYEALEGSTVSVTGGTVDLVASDDGINAAGEPDDAATDGASGTGAAAAGDAAAAQADGTAPAAPGAAGAPAASGGMDENDPTAKVLIAGGTVTVDAAGDGIDSNGDLTITGGETYVSGPTSGADGALDYAGTGTITGGVLVAAGSSQMAQNLGPDSTQGTMLVSANGSAGDAVTLTDADGTVLASFSPAKEYQSVVISAPGVAAGQTYTLTCGSSSTQVTMDSLVYNGVAGTGAPGAMGGGEPGGQGMPGVPDGSAVPGAGGPQGADNG